MVADKEFPVFEGTPLLLSCYEGHELRGEKIVTCYENTNFLTESKQEHMEPTCCEYQLLSKFLPISLCTNYTQLEFEILVCDKAFSPHDYV